jgi:hypothetical protein
VGGGGTSNDVGQNPEPAPWNPASAVENGGGGNGSSSGSQAGGGNGSGNGSTTSAPGSVPKIRHWDVVSETMN